MRRNGLDRAVDWRDQCQQPFTVDSIEVLWARSVCDNAIEFIITPHGGAIDLLGVRPSTCPAGGYGLSVSIRFSRGVPAETVHAGLVDARETERTSAGDFSLTIADGSREYAPSEPIDIRAELLYGGPQETIALSGAGLMGGFSVEQLDGSHALDPEVTASCEWLEMTDGQPVISPFGKSGVLSEDAPFDRAWFDDPELRLPTGTWLLTAYSNFTIESECEGDGVNLEASIVVVVH